MGLDFRTEKHGDLSPNACDEIAVARLPRARQPRARRPRGRYRRHPYGYPRRPDARDADDDYIEVHGGLTFAAGCSEQFDPGTGRPVGVCHVAEPGTDDDVWWFGFDCAHAGDLSPGYSRLFSALACHDDVYRSASYVAGHVRVLALALHGAG